MMGKERTGCILSLQTVAKVYPDPKPDGVKRYRFFNIHLLE